MALNLEHIVGQFDIAGEVKSIERLGKGYINDTYLVKTVNEADNNYLLQRKNKKVFRMIPGMMDNIEKISNHLKKKIIQAKGNPEREAVTLVRTRKGELFFVDEKEAFWTICLFIRDSVIYEKVSSPALAFAGGKGIGKFQSMLADFQEVLVDTLPGFHNIRYRFRQWDEALENDVAGRKKNLREEISWIESRRKEMMNFWGLVENGTLPRRVTHNDTKISNILFDTKGKVLCLIDLDTVLNSIVLNDVGDAIRSYANTGKEDDQNLHDVNMDINIFKSFAEGYLSESHSFLSPPEIEYLAFSASFITFEQVLRFLMDHMNGDEYYRIGYKGHNLVRASAQYKLLQSMEEQLPQMNLITEEIISQLGT